MKMIIAGEKITQDDDGRYSLNEMHYAYGYPSSKRPIKFCRLESVKNIVTLLESDNAIAPIVKRRGRGLAGTWVCLELAVKYKMWVKSELELEVIQLVITKVWGGRVAKWN